MVQTKCKLNNTELSASNCFIFRAKKTTRNNKNYEGTTELEKWHSEISPEYSHQKEDGRLKAEWHKTTDYVHKIPTEFSSKSATAANVHLTESPLDNWLKNSNITVDIIYHLCSQFVSLFLRILVFKFISQPRKTELKQNFVATR